MITERQAHIWFMAAAGMTPSQIAIKFNCSREAAQDALARARKKATMLGVRVMRDDKPKQPVFETPYEVKPSRFEQLKQLASEIKNERKTSISHTA